MMRGVVNDRWQQRGTVTALLAILLLPILGAYSIVWRYFVNVPIIDDYVTILGFAVKYSSLPTAGQRFHYILADQYVEYKLVLLHILSAAELALTHHISFAFHAWVGNLALLPLIYVLWRTYFLSVSSTVKRLILFVPITFILFAMNYAEAMDWAAPAIGYIGTTTLCLSAIYLLTETPSTGSNWRIAGASLLTFLAYLLSANAYLVLPIALYLLLRRRAYGWVTVWCALFALSLVPYLVYFVKDTRPGTGPLWLIPVWFVAFIGSSVLPVNLAIPVGVVILVLYGAAARSAFWRSHPGAFFGMTWLLGSAALAAIGRGRTGIPFALVSRYKIFSDLFFIFCYGYLVERIRASSIKEQTQRRLYAAALAISILFCIRCDQHGIAILRDRRSLLLAGVDHYRQDPQRNSPMWFNNQDHDTFFAAYEVKARQAIVDAEHLGLYRLP